MITDGISSNSSAVTSGVPQGTVLAPLLFLCFVNDIPRLVSSKIRLYADDILLYSIINSNEDCISLQNDIDKLLNWSRDWQLLFNYEKCEYLRITTKFHQLRISTYYMDINIIKEVSSVKYLGVTINSKLNWSEHIARITSKASSVLGFL